MEPVYARVAQDLDVVRTSVAELKDRHEPAVTWWSAQQLRTWADRPWNKDGKQLPLVHHAAVDFEVKFCDFEALSTWVGEHVTNLDGFHVRAIRWSLTEKRRLELIRRVREQAVHDAVERAQQYAGALGLGEVESVGIADAGMLEAHLRPDGAPGRASMVAGIEAAPAGAPEVRLVPEDIEVAAAVDARFIADGQGSTSGHNVESEPDAVEFRDDG
ncbi:hypothetical protein BHQ18_10330 [Mycolicibacterium flavescens]|uniref:SIMPL domain-containing protein n=2 Tax=Mycolicibacterium flavescens TaxID=1776 RepID=A0A1E3RM05_MYCFV|nr:hypothetical protein BHQ18_10330 [Mycolicibacterium flavescens]